MSGAISPWPCNFKFVTRWTKRSQGREQRMSRTFSNRIVCAVLLVLLPVGRAQGSPARSQAPSESGSALQLLELRVRRRPAHRDREDCRRAPGEQSADRRFARQVPGGTRAQRDREGHDAAARKVTCRRARPAARALADLQGLLPEHEVSPDHRGSLPCGSGARRHWRPCAGFRARPPLARGRSGARADGRGGVARRAGHTAGDIVSSTGRSAPRPTPRIRQRLARALRAMQTLPH